MIRRIAITCGPDGKNLPISLTGANQKIYKSISSKEEIENKVMQDQINDYDIYFTDNEVIDYRFEKDSSVIIITIKSDDTNLSWWHDVKRIKLP